MPPISLGLRTTTTRIVTPPFHQCLPQDAPQMTSATPNITTSSLVGNIQQVSNPAPNAEKQTKSTQPPCLCRRRMVIPAFLPRLLTEYADTAVGVSIF